MKTAMYRHFDADGALLYVGISLNSIKRTMQHKVGAHWFRQIARIDIEWLATREEAEQVERDAIRSERPAHNVMHACGLPLKDDRDRRGFAVRHVKSGFRDGWYFSPADAQRVLGWFRALFPRDEFELVRPSFDGDAVTDEKWLQCDKWRRWGAATPPDDAAGDRYDREAA